MRRAITSLLVLLGCAASAADSNPPATAPVAAPGGPAATDPGAGAEAAQPGASGDCGDAEACLARAAELEATDPDAATDALYGACLGGAVDGCEQAGLRWQKQLEATGDDPRNAKLMDAWNRSCELGGRFGCGNVGLAHFFGTYGANVDADKALKFMKKSCEEQGDAFLCRKLEQAESGAIKPGVLP